MIHFGTGGWRAVIGDEFTKENIQIFAAALSQKMIDEKVDAEGIVIGYDRRFLSKEAMQWIAEVLAYYNIKSQLVNKSCPTPVVMYLVQRNNFHYGLMVTASHNPALYNGIKVFTYGGKDADIEVTRNIEEYISRVKTPVNHLEYQSAADSGIIREIYPINDYIDSILDDLDMDAIKKANLKIALDPMYGVSETAIKTIMITCRTEVETIHGGHDTLFGGHMPAPDKMLLDELTTFVKVRKCSLGIATDGDADRIGIVDDTGRYLDANDIMLLLYWYLMEYRNMKGPVVRNLCTTHSLDELARQYGQKCYEVPVGFKWVSAKMEETGAIIGGESSGGMAIQGRIKGKDGVYAAALLVEMIARTGKKMSELYDDLKSRFGERYLETKSYPFKPELKETFVRTIMEDKKIPVFDKEIDHISYMDGSKIYFKDESWVSVRFSGTEPLLRIFAEAKTRDEAESICSVWADYLKI